MTSVPRHPKHLVETSRLYVRVPQINLNKLLAVEVHRG